MRRDVYNYEGNRYTLSWRKYDEFHGITLAFITLNEEEYIVDFLKHIKPLVKSIVMIDGGSRDRTIELATPHVNTLKIMPFRGHFSSQRNETIKLCYTDWTLLLDPDETLTPELYKLIPSLIEQTEYDCFSFPRREFRDGKEDKDVYPDFQERLFRSYCRCIRPIHHEIVGWKKKKEIEINKNLDIIHNKKQKRHDERNNLYTLLERHYMHELGSPAEQNKAGFLKEYPHLNIEDEENRKAHGVE